MWDRDIYPWDMLACLSVAVFLISIIVRQKRAMEGTTGLDWLTRWSDRLPCRLIYGDNGEPYLRRYYVGTMLGFRVYLHHFVGSDPMDRGLHSHPWRYALSIILRGWYFEERFRGDPGLPPILRQVRRWNFLMGESFHRVVLPKDALIGTGTGGGDRYSAADLQDMPTSCWSLFILREGAERRWGFIQEIRRIDTDGGPGATKPAGSYRFEPFTYPTGKKTSGNWWEAAPSGKTVRLSLEAKEFLQ